MKRDDVGMCQPAWVTAGMKGGACQDCQRREDDREKCNVPPGHMARMPGVAMSLLRNDGSCVECNTLEGIAVFQAKDSVPQVDEEMVLLCVGLVGHGWQGQLDNQGVQAVLEGFGMNVSEYLKTEANDMVVRDPSAAVVTLPVRGHNVAVGGENRVRRQEQTLQETVPLSWNTPVPVAKGKGAGMLQRTSNQ